MFPKNISYLSNQVDRLEIFLKNISDLYDQVDYIEGTRSFLWFEENLSDQYGHSTLITSPTSPTSTVIPTTKPSNLF